MATQAERWISGAGPGFDVPGISADEARRNRIATFQERAQRFPGVVGNGPTGVSDAHGYNDMLAAQRQFLDDTNAESGRGPMGVRSAPLSERASDGGPMRGLQMAVQGGSGMGGGRMGGESGDDEGAGRVARLSNALKSRELESELMNPRGNRDYGENLTPEELHAASAGDFMAKAQARTAGQVYNMPEVAGPREDEWANKLAQITRQYIDPANIKADADMGAAELGYEGQMGRATGQENAARLSGAAAIRAAQERARGQQSAADSNMLGDLGSYGTDPKALLGLIQALRQAGVIGGGAPGGGGGR